MTDRYKRAPIGEERRRQRAALLFESQFWYLIANTLEKAQSVCFTMMWGGFVLLVWSTGHVILNASLNLSLEAPYDTFLVGTIFCVSGFLGWEVFIFLSLDIQKDLREINNMLDRLG